MHLFNCRTNLVRIIILCSAIRVHHADAWTLIVDSILASGHRESVQSNTHKCEHFAVEHFHYFYFFSCVDVSV